jgi:hypothetical protein
VLEKNLHTFKIENPQLLFGLQNYTLIYNIRPNHISKKRSLENSVYYDLSPLLSPKQTLKLGFYSKHQISGKASLKQL